MKQKFYSLAFILYLFFSFIGQFFILNRVFGEGVGTVLIGCSFFHWAFGIVSSTSCFCQQKWLENHKFIGFRFYFFRFCIWFCPCWGGGPTTFMLGLIAFPSNAVVYAVSTGIKSMIKDFLQGED